jgi:hypothetical protein
MCGTSPREGALQLTPLQLALWLARAGVRDASQYPVVPQDTAEFPAWALLGAGAPVVQVRVPRVAPHLPRHLPSPHTQHHLLPSLSPFYSTVRSAALSVRVCVAVYLPPLSAVRYPPPSTSPSASAIACWRRCSHDSLLKLGPAVMVRVV